MTISHTDGCGNVAVVYRFGFLGGAERNGLVSMQALRERGWQSTLCCPIDGRLAEKGRSHGFDVEDYRIGPDKIEPSPRWIIQTAVSVAQTNVRMRRVCRSRRIDLMHIHGPIAAVGCLLACRAGRIPMMVHVHDAQPPKRTYRAAVSLANRCGALFLCVSEASRAVIRSLGVQELRTAVGYNGLSDWLLNTHFSPEPSVEGPGPHIGLVGHIYELKGQKVLLDAARILVKEFPTAMFHLIGELTYEDSRPYYEELQRMANLTELKGHVVFAGHRDNVPEWMAAMDIIASTSILPEALPTVCLEAMSLGKLVVGTNTGGTLEIIKNGENGFLVPPNDPTALAETLGRMLRLPPDNEIGRRAAEDIRQRFTPKAFADAIEGQYRRLLGDNCCGIK